MMQRVFNKLHGDRIIWLVVLGLSLFGVLAVYSSTGTLAFKYKGGNTEYYLLKHFALLALGLGMMYIAHLANYRIYSRISQLLLWICIPLLLYTLLFGSDINDAKRWITVPGINLSFQTSDLAKLALIMFTARFISKKQDDIKSFKGAFFPIIATIAGVCALIAPADLSSAVTLFFTCLLLLFIGRVRMRYILATVGAGILVFGSIIMLAYSFPDVGRFNTWTNRIDAFVYGEGDNWQADQAKIAIAEGGWIGKGPGNSSQKNFLPHPYSDFIYSIIFEEYGMFGGVFIIFLYMALLYRTVKIVIKSPGAFGAMLAVGLSLSLVLQAMIHMAVAVTLLPVTGLTLPLVSMGGTSLWFTSLAIGIVLSVSRSIDQQPIKDKLEKPEKEAVSEAA